MADDKWQMADGKLPPGRGNAGTAKFLNEI
jgi:hypothetical protein